MSPLRPRTMKLFPPLVYEACPSFPQGSGVILERPWWRRIFHPDPFAGGYLRSDDVVTLVPDDLNQYVVAGPPGIPGMELHAAFAEVDRRHPIRHPGFRAGQVWSDAFGNTVAVQRYGRDTLYYLDGKARYIATATPDEFLREGYAFLVADPCCPHLSPWSVPESP